MHKSLVCFIIACVFIVAVIVFGAIYATIPMRAGYVYNNEVHSHMENAYYSADPYTMKEELNLAVEGMHNLDLTEDMYGAWLPWDKVPANRMSWQYTHMNSIQKRVDEFVSWEQSQTGTDTQQMNDVYSSKLDNARHFIKSDGWSDDVAQRAYLYNVAFFESVVCPIIIMISFIISLIFVFLMKVFE